MLILPRSSLSMTAARLHHSGDCPMEAGALGVDHGPVVVGCPSKGAWFAPRYLCKAGPGNDLLPEGAFQQQRVGRFRESQTRKGRNRPGRSPAQDDARVVRLHLLHSGQDAFPIRNIVVPHSPQAPLVAGLPFFIVTCWAFWISRLSRHFRQYPVIGSSSQS